MAEPNEKPKGERDPGGKFLPGNSFRWPKGIPSPCPQGHPAKMRLPSEVAFQLVNTPLSPAVLERLGYPRDEVVTLGEAMLARAGFEGLMGKSATSIARLDQFLRLLEPVKHLISAEVDASGVTELAARLDRLFAQRAAPVLAAGPNTKRTNGAGTGS